MKSCGSVIAEKPAAATRLGEKRRTLALVGNPNVGKSLVFNHLSGGYATVSNYPGTTVAVTRGKSKIPGVDAEVIDMPGMYSIIPITEEERVARAFAIGGEADLIVHIVDAKNLERMLPLTFQLMEAGVPLILCLNMTDELERLRLQIDREKLEQILGIPVVCTTAVKGKGVEELRQAIRKFERRTATPLNYIKNEAGRLVEAIEKQLRASYPISRRAVALLSLQEDPEILNLIEEKEGAGFAQIAQTLRQAKKELPHSFSFVLALQRQHEIDRIIQKVFTESSAAPSGFGEKLSRLMMNPWTGLPILGCVLYFGLYQFVGVFGGGTLVDWIEGGLFETYVNPFLAKVFEKIIPWEILRALFTGEYGVLTLGVRYAVALVLPIVGSFFLFFAIVEDTGYLPRLGMLIDRVFKKIGLNGRAVIPIVLGFGCDTMATMVTRILETKRERIIATLLLALAIPCSAQLGVILAVLSAHPRALAAWAGIIALEFLLVGFLAARLLPGAKANFYMELPPLRWPRFSNVLLKTLSRVEWYFKEVFPLFILASVLIWVGQVTRIFDGLIRSLEPVVQGLGLPKEAAVTFLFGFFRRDYGAAGLYDLNSQGLLTGVNLLVASATLTLFLPCIAQFLIMKKERGLKMTLFMSGFILVMAFGTGFLLNAICVNMGWVF